MTEPSKDCPLCGARLDKSGALTDGVAVVMQEALRRLTRARIAALALALLNAISIVLMLWAR